MKELNKVILTPNPYRDKNFQTVREAMRVLTEAGIDAKICLPFEVDKTYDLPRDLRFSRLDRELPGASMVICFGGDGTILHMAKTATRHNIPILGVNIGTMGFMAELESSELSQLARIATGDYTVDERMMLDVTVHRERDIIFHDICLNDVVITKGAVARIVHLAVNCDGVQAMECGGDGIIVATPTGSTAYCMSAGGPIIDPELDCICAVPVCPYMCLNNGAVVFSGSSVIEVEFKADKINEAFCTVDGKSTKSIYDGDIVRITKAPTVTKLLRLKDTDFYSRLNEKMNLANN